MENVISMRPNDEFYPMGRPPKTWHSATYPNPLPSRLHLTMFYSLANSEMLLSLRMASGDRPSAQVTNLLPQRFLMVAK